MLNRLTDKDTEPGAIKAFFCIKDEKYRLPYFLDYYRKLGVDEFFAIDNDSTDGTLEYLLEQKDVHVFHTTASYRDSNAGRDWTHEVSKRYGLGCWCLTLDTDEFLVYPYSEYCGLKDLCAYLDAKGYEGMYGIFLDHYAQQPLEQTFYQPGQSVFEVCPYYDPPDNYVAFSGKNFPHIQIKGGVRQRLFWPDGGERGGPAQRKLPLIKNDERFQYLYSTHSSNEIRLADITGVLAHFKFFSSFAEFVDREVEGDDRKNPQDYMRYQDGLDQELTHLYLPGQSREFRGSVGYIEDHMMCCTLEAFDWLFHRLCSRNYDQFNPVRVELREKLSQKLRQDNLSFAEVMKLWPAIAHLQAGMLSQHGKRRRPLAEREADIVGHIESVKHYKSIAFTRRLRWYLFNKGYVDRKALLEALPEGLTEREKIRAIYESVWWDLAAGYRLWGRFVRWIRHKLKREK